MLLITIAGLSALMVVTSYPKIGIGIEELVSSNGFPLQTHNVTTEDGYILTVHRIPHGKRNKEQGPRQPVLIVHGIMSTSIDWLNVDDTKSLGFMLADNGYDVWLGNIRGNTFSRKHITLDPYLNRTHFWDFSWHEMGYYDLPAMVDLILLETGYKSIQFVTYSQGATSFFVMTTTRPEYNSKIKFAQLLAPVADAGNIRSLLLRPLVPVRYWINLFANILSVSDIFTWSEFYRDFWQEMCDKGKPWENICKLLLSSLVGYSTDQWHEDFIPVILSNFPAGTNVKSVYHFGQTSSRQEFRHFDYGSAVNLQKYGSRTPPKYDLSLITIPVALYYGIHDSVSVETDVRKIARQLPNVVFMKRVNSNHNGFIWYQNLDVLVNNDIIKNLEMHK